MAPQIIQEVSDARHLVGNRSRSGSKAYRACKKMLFLFVSGYSFRFFLLPRYCYSLSPSLFTLSFFLLSVLPLLSFSSSMFYVFSLSTISFAFFPSVLLIIFPLPLFFVFFVVLCVILQCQLFSLFLSVSYVVLEFLSSFNSGHCPQMDCGILSILIVVYIVKNN